MVLQGNLATPTACNLELGRLVAGCRRQRLNAGPPTDMIALTVSLSSSSLYDPHCVSEVLNSPLRICLADLDMWICKLHAATMTNVFARRLVTLYLTGVKIKPKAVKAETRSRTVN